MTTNEWIGNACNGHHITGLSRYSSGAAGAKKAMITFFEQEVKQSSSRYDYHHSNHDGYAYPAAHYVFTSGNASYGKNFADYIKTHKLGLVVTAGLVENKKYHPKRMCQVWIWVPDRAALIAWWEQLHPPTPKEKLLVTPKTKNAVAPDLDMKDEILF